MAPPECRVVDTNVLLVMTSMVRVSMMPCPCMTSQSSERPACWRKGADNRSNTSMARTTA